MDPITRRHVWDIIEGAKKGRAIILTTHSMEEADILSDRIGIMAKGKLRCIGTSLYLKSRFGTGYIVSVSLSRKNNGKSSPDGDARANRVKSFFKEVMLNLLSSERPLSDLAVRCMWSQLLITGRNLFLSLTNLEFGCLETWSRTQGRECGFHHICHTSGKRRPVDGIVFGLLHIHIIVKKHACYNPFL